MREMLELAHGLSSPPLTMYLEERRTMLAIEWKELQPSLTALRHLASTLR